MTINFPSLGPSWIPKALGLVIALLGAAKTYGVHLGHVGQGDWIDFALVLLAAGLAWSVKQSNVTGGTVAATAEAQTRLGSQSAAPAQPVKGGSS